MHLEVGAHRPANNPNSSKDAACDAPAFGGLLRAAILADWTEPFRFVVDKVHYGVHHIREVSIRPEELWLRVIEWPDI